MPRKILKSNPLFMSIYDETNFEILFCKKCIWSQIDINSFCANIPCKVKFFLENIAFEIKLTYFKIFLKLKMDLIFLKMLHFKEIVTEDPCFSAILIQKDVCIEYIKIKMKENFWIHWKTQKWNKTQSKLKSILKL